MIGIFVKFEILQISIQNSFFPIRTICHHCFCFQNLLLVGFDFFHTHFLFFMSAVSFIALLKLAWLYSHLFHDGTWCQFEAYSRDADRVFCKILFQTRSGTFHSRHTLFCELVRQLALDVFIPSSMKVVYPCLPAIRRTVSNLYIT